jgi:outer membrane protein assembly factor BamB
MNKAWWLLLSVLLTACGSVKDQPMGEPPKALSAITEKFKPRIPWQIDTGAKIADSYLELVPQIVNDKVILLTPEGEVGAYRLSNGERLWHTQTHKALTSSAGIGEGLILVGTEDGELLALNESNGEQKWQAQASSEILSQPKISNGLIAVRTVDGRVAGFNSGTGERLWIYDRDVPALSLRGNSAPILVDGAVISGFDSGWLVAINGVNGKVLWERQIEEPRGRTDLERMVDLDAELLLDKEILYVSSYQGQTMALNLYNSEIRWSRQHATYTGLAMDSQAIYLSDEKSHLWALDKETGNSLWKQEDLAGRSLSAPTKTGDYLVVADYQGYIHWLDSKDGKIIARIATEKEGIRTRLQATEQGLLALNNRGRLFYIQQP